MSTLLRGLELQQAVLRLDRHRQRVALPERPAVVHLSEPAADTQAQQARASLQEEQRRWREQAEEELSNLRARVEQEARAAGHAKGLEEARAQHAARLERLDALLSQLGGLLGQQLEQVQDLVVAVAYESVVKILGRAAVTPEGVRALVMEAVAQVRQQEELVIRVAAQDYRLLLEDLPAEHPLARPGIAIRPDPELADGGCVVDTDAGRLDARLQTQLAALRDVLVQARRQLPGGTA